MFAVEDHREGERPFATEYFERKKVERLPVKPSAFNCAHCEDRMFCDCRSCTLGRQTDAAPCSMCRGIEREVWKEATAPKRTMFEEWMKGEVNPLYH
jgi:hypothetical protein